MRYFSCLIVLLVLTSCNRNLHKDEDVLARVYDKYLYSSELQKVIPPGTNAKDSLMMAKNYINNWVRQNLVIHQAERNLTDEQKDFEKQMEAYRNSLITYQYESLLKDQKLDTVVSDEQIEAYYDENKQNFELRENLIICNYVILNPDSVDKKNIAELLKSDETEDLDRISFLCDSLRLDCYLNNNHWVAFRELTRQVPIETMDEENFIRNKNYTEIRETSDLYLLRIRDFRIMGDIAPLEHVKEDIRRILLNRRKTMLIKQMEEEMFNNALENNEIEIY